MADIPISVGGDTKVVKITEKQTNATIANVNGKGKPLQITVTTQVNNRPKSVTIALTEPWDITIDESAQ